MYVKKIYIQLVYDKNLFPMLIYDLGTQNK